MKWVKTNGETYLHDCLLALDLKHLTFSHGSIAKSDVDDFGILWELDIVKHDKWSFDI